MGGTPDKSNPTGSDPVEVIRQIEEQEWEDVAEETAFTKRQIAMWKLAIEKDFKQWQVGDEYGVSESTVSRHVERFREKADQVDEKIEELEAELQRWKETKRYLESLAS